MHNLMIIALLRVSTPFNSFYRATEYVQCINTKTCEITEICTRSRSGFTFFLVDFIFVDMALANRFTMSAKIFLSPNYWTKLRENALVSTAR